LKTETPLTHIPCGPPAVAVRFVAAEGLFGICSVELEPLGKLENTPAVISLENHGPI